MRTSFKTKNAARGACTKALGNDKFVKKIMPYSYPMKKKSSKQVVSMVHTFGKYLFEAATFKGL